MPRGPKIKPHIKRLIYDKAVRERQEPRMCLVVKLTDLIEKMREVPPSEETMAKMISHARSGPKEEDAEWTLASCVNEEFPVNTIPTLLRVWRYCTLVNITFSVRHARWAARLSNVIRETDRLWAVSAEYVLREQTADRLGEDLYTADLDAALVMGKWEYLTATWHGSLNPRSGMPFPYYSPFHEPPDILEDDNFDPGKDLEGYIADQALVQLQSIGFAAEEARAISEELHSLPALNVPAQSRWVYARWLLGLSTQWIWQLTPGPERVQVIKKLRDWIESHPWNDPRVEDESWLHRPWEVASKPEMLPAEIMRELRINVKLQEFPRIGWTNKAWERFYESESVPELSHEEIAQELRKRLSKRKGAHNERPHKKKR